MATYINFTTGKIDVVEAVTGCFPSLSVNAEVLGLSAEKKTHEACCMWREYANLGSGYMCAREFCWDMYGVQGVSHGGVEFRIDPFDGMFTCFVSFNRWSDVLYHDIVRVLNRHGVAFDTDHEDDDDDDEPHYSEARQKVSREQRSRLRSSR